MEKTTADLVLENKWDLENRIDVYWIALRVNLPKKVILNEFCIFKCCLLIVLGRDFFFSSKETGNDFLFLNVDTLI